MLTKNILKKQYKAYFNKRAAAPCGTQKGDKVKNLQDVIYRDIESDRTFTPSITKSGSKDLTCFY